MILQTKFSLILTTSWPGEKELFLKFAIREIRKISFENPIFSLSNLSYTNFFLFFTLITLVIHHFEFGLIWTTPWPNEKDLFLKLAKIRNARILQNSVWKPNFFPRQALPKYDLRNTPIALVILHTEFGLIWATPWPDEKDLFLKFLFREIQKFRKKY